MNGEFDGKLGSLSYTLICRESILDFIFPFYDGVIFVSMDKDIPIHDMSDKILKLVQFQSKPTAEFDECA